MTHTILTTISYQVIGGALEEFIFAPRLDNLVNCYTALQGLLASESSLGDDGNIRLVAFYDNEEVLYRILIFVTVFAK